MHEVHQKLTDHNLRKTAVRTQVLSMFMENKGNALTNQNIEDSVSDLDRITLYRTLKVFEKNGIIHQIFDSSGKIKYALCPDGCGQLHHHDDHAHFHCEGCDRTICVVGEVKSDISIPKTYQVKRVHLVVEGMCDSCNPENTKNKTV